MCVKRFASLKAAASSLRSRNLGTSVVKLTAKEVMELLDLRELLEVGAVRLAATNITEEHLERLRNLLSVLEHSGNSAVLNMFTSWRNLDLHYEIALASGNDRLIRLLSGEIWILMRSYRFPRRAQHTAYSGRLRRPPRHPRSAVPARPGCLRSP